MAWLCSFHDWVVVRCIEVPCLPFLFISLCTFRLFSGLGYCEQCFYEHRSACSFLNYGFVWIYAQECGEGNDNPLQCSCLENPRDGGAWWAAVYGVAQSWTQLKRLSSSSSSMPRSGIAGPLILFLVLWGCSVLLSTVAVPIYIPTNSVEGLLCLHTLSRISYL